MSTTPIEGEKLKVVTVARLEKHPKVLYERGGKVPKGYHWMPDGSLMKDSDMKHGGKVKEQEDLGSKKEKTGIVFSKSQEKRYRDWIKEGNATKIGFDKWLEQTTQNTQEFTYNELKKFFWHEYIKVELSGEELEEYAKKHLRKGGKIPSHAKETKYTNLAEDHEVRYSKNKRKSKVLHYLAKGGKIDDLGNPTDPKVLREMEAYIEKEMPKLSKKTYITHGMRRKKAKGDFYFLHGYGAFHPKFADMFDYKHGGNVLHDKKVTHFAIHKPTGKIINAWNYRGYDKEELDSEKDHYFYFDLLNDFDINKKADAKIVTRAQLDKMKLDPQDIKNWYRPEYGLGGLILGGIFGAYFGYKVGKSQEKSKDVFRTEKEIQALLKKKRSERKKKRIARLAN